MAVNVRESLRKHDDVVGFLACDHMHWYVEK